MFMSRKTLCYPDINFICKFNAITVKSQQVILQILKIYFKFISRGKQLRIANTMLKEKNKVGGLVLSGFKTDCKAMIIKTVWNWQKNREIDS